MRGDRTCTLCAFGVTGLAYADYAFVPLPASREPMSNDRPAILRATLSAGRRTCGSPVARVTLGPTRRDVMDEARLIEIVQEQLRDRDTRKLALSGRAVSRSFVYRIERRLYLNPQLDRYIGLCTLIGLEVYAFSALCDSAMRLSEELRHHCTLHAGSISGFARRHGFSRQNVSNWCRGKHYPRLRVALHICDLLGSTMFVRAMT